MTVSCEYGSTDRGARARGTRQRRRGGRCAGDSRTYPGFVSDDPRGHVRWRRPRRGAEGSSGVALTVTSSEPGVGDVSNVEPSTRLDSVAYTEQPLDFDGLFDAHYERLVRALTVVAGDREVAADAVQEAFVKAHLNWNRISRYDDPSGWVRRVAINRLRDEQRHGRRKRRALQRLGSRREQIADTPEIDEFGRLLAALPRQQRLSTALFYVDNLTIAEIAAALGVSDGTVKSHLHDARRRLRSVLETEAHDV